MPDPKLPLRGDELTELHPSKPASERTESIDISVDVEPPVHESGHRSRQSRSGTGNRHLRRSTGQSGQRSLRTGPGRAVRTGPRRPPGRSALGHPNGDCTDPNIGRILGSYKIQTLIGSGGMGQVYSAEHVILGRRVALKLLRPEYSVKRDAVHRFFQEARAVNTIGHENIVDITDFVELDTGETFFIMELLQGQDLGELLRGAKRPLPLHHAMQIAMQVCDGLEAAHAANIVHRDLKPDNIFILETKKSNFVKVLDFGVAKLQDHDVNNSWQTAAGSVIGTPAYMSPEQASSIPVDNRSDIYSLGAILYELFTGHPVFRAKSFGEYVVKHMNDIPIPPRELPNAPTIPLALERVILKCLEKDPKDRYQSVEDLRDDLARATATVETAVKDISPHPRSHGRLALIGFVGFGMVTLAIGAFLVASGLGSSDPSPTVDDRPMGSPSKVGAPPARVEARQPGPSAKPQPKVTPITERSVRITLRTDPPGAQVFKAGKRLDGVTPIEVSENVGDIVEYTFSLEGHKQAAETLEILGEDTEIRVPLESLDGAKPTVRRRNKRWKRRQGGRRRGKKINPGDQLDPFR